MPNTIDISLRVLCLILIVQISICSHKFSNDIVSCHQNGLKIAIVHLCTQKAAWYSTHAQAINIFYARRHGYDFITHACPVSTNKYMWDDEDQVRANWAKPAIIAKYLKEYHYVLMLDADAFISNPSITIEEMIATYLTPANVSIVVPKNCMVKETREPDSYICWNDSGDIPAVNIGAILAKSTPTAHKILNKWYKSVENECNKFVYPQWKSVWIANDQQCLSLLIKNHQEFQEAIYVLTKEETFEFIGGASYQWITHYLGGNRDREKIGRNIRNVLSKLALQNSYTDLVTHESSNIWLKHKNPVFGGGELGTCFDLSVLKVNEMSNKFAMYFSWRPKLGIGLTHSGDGFHWDKNPHVVLQGVPDTWQREVNRPMVLKVHNKFYMWYTGQVQPETSMIGFARSNDGINWQRLDLPVLKPKLPWEAKSLMCSHVIYNEAKKTYYMYYSGGHQTEPYAIGHAISSNGIDWNRTQDEPIFLSNKTIEWEKDRVTCATVIYYGEYYYMFYIGFKNVNNAAIGMARSRNGINSWERHKKNPIVKASEGSWDADAVYKPDLLYSGGKWYMWFNGRHQSLEQIGVATLGSHDFGFET